MNEQRQNIPAKRWTCKHWHSGQHANASEPCGYCALEAEIEALRKALMSIARMDPEQVRADDLGRAVSIAYAALATRPGGEG